MTNVLACDTVLNFDILLELVGVGSASGCLSYFFERCFEKVVTFEVRQSQNAREVRPRLLLPAAIAVDTADVLRSKMHLCVVEKANEGENDEET